MTTILHSGVIMTRLFAIAFLVALSISHFVIADDGAHTKPRKISKKAFGTIKFFESPATNESTSFESTNVYVDDQFVGNAISCNQDVSPVLNLPKGNTKFRIERAGYDSFETTLHVVGHGSTQWVVFQLSPTASVESTKIDPQNPEQAERVKQTRSPPEPNMTKYKNLGGDSNIAEYECGDDYIKVRFTRSTAIYVYDSHVPGLKIVAEMKQLAESGQGLSSYIYRNVRSKFSRKE
jgi:hypothetical protein